MKSVAHFSRVWDNSGERAAVTEQRFPVITVCPTTSDYDGQIKQMSCSGFGPNSFKSFTAAEQKVQIGTISGAEEEFSCWTLNEKQDYVGFNSSYVLLSTVPAPRPTFLSVSLFALTT